MRCVVISLLLVMNLSVLAETVSATLQPTQQLAGSMAFNFTEQGELVLAIYESATVISESSVELPSQQLSELVEEIKFCLHQIQNLEDYDGLQQSSILFGAIHSKGRITKSVATRKHSVEIRRLIAKLNKLVPSEYKIAQASTNEL